MEPFRTLELDMQKSLKYKYMKVRFGRVDVNYYKRLEKYLFDDLNAVFIEGIRNENLCVRMLFRIECRFQ